MLTLHELPWMFRWEQPPFWVADLSDEKPNYAIDAFLVACEATLGYIIWKMNVWIADSQRSSS